MSYFPPVADIDCAVGTSGKELFTARLRRPDGFRGTPIFADDRGGAIKDYVVQELQDGPCVILPDVSDSSGRVFKMRITDFTRCGVLKRNVRIYPKLELFLNAFRYHDHTPNRRDHNR